MRCSLLLVALLAGCATTLPPETATVPPGLDLPAFDVQTLDNGLTLVTVENHAHPIVGVTAYVTTGGRTETAHYAGALHYLEHLVFKGGTANLPPTVFRKKIAELGDENGGWTWDDEIQFGFEVPKHNFDAALDVFAEALFELRFSQRVFDDERKVVLQEIEKDDEQPWDKLWRAFDAEAFKKHPYGRAVIGDAATIKAQTLAELEAYYKDRFTPNHVVLIVVGDFETAALVERIKGRFARYQPGPATFELDDVREEEQTAPRRARVADPTAKRTKFIVGFRTPGASSEDTPALLLLGALLSSPTEGLPAYLERKHQWVTGLRAGFQFMVDYGQLTIEGEVDPRNAAAVLGWLEGFVTTLPSHPFSRAAVAEARRGLLASRAREWESFGQQAQGLGFWIERMGAQAARLATGRLLAATPESLSALAARLLTPERWVEAVLAPPDSGAAASGQVQGRDRAAKVPDLHLPGLLEPAEAPPWTYRETGREGGVVRYTFDSGLTVLVRPSTASPLVWVMAYIAGGQWVEPAAKAGIGVLTARLATAGSAHLGVTDWDRVMSAEAISHQTALGFDDRSNVSRNVHYRDGATLAFGGTRQTWRTALALAGEAVFRPTFPDGEVAKAREVLLSEIDTLSEDNLELIKQEFYRFAYAGHPYGRPTIGDRSTVEAIAAADVRAFHAATWTPDRVTIAVSGHVKPEEVAELVATRLGDVKGTRAGPLPATTAPEPRPVPERRKTLVLGKQQHCVNFGFTTLPSSDPRFPALDLVTAIARGRHFYKYVYDRGVSYRSWIKVWEHRGPSAWILENDINHEAFDPTVAEMEHDLQDYARAAFSQLEVNLSRTRALNRAVLDEQNGLLMAFELARAQGDGLGFEHQVRLPAAYRAVTLEQVNALAREVFGNRDLYRLILK